MYSEAGVMVSKLSHDCVEYNNTNEGRLPNTLQFKQPVMPGFPCTTPGMFRAYAHIIVTM